MKVLLFSLQVSLGASKGHLHPLLAVAQELRAQGHQVLWVPLPSPMGAADAENLGHLGFTLLQPPPLPPGTLLDPAELERLASDPDTVWKAYQSFLLAPVPHQVPWVRALLREQRPDVVVSDMMVYPALFAARLAGVPDVGICAGLKALAPDVFEGHYFGNCEPLRPLRARLVESLGLTAEFRLFECLSPYANLVFATPAFAGLLSGDRAGIELVGPTCFRSPREDEPPEAEAELPALAPGFVYAAFGSIYDPVRYPNLVEGLMTVTAERGVKLLLGSRALSEAGGLPPHVLARRYWPQRALLARAGVFVTHGGANSTMEGILAGVPQLVVPLSADQPIQARLVAAAGIGLSVDARTVDVPQMRAALGALLSPGNPFVPRAQALAAEYGRFNGSQRAAERIAAVGGRA